MYFGNGLELFYKYKFNECMVSIMFDDIASKFSCTYLLDYSNELAVGADANGIIILFNKAAEIFFKLDKKDIINKKFSDFAKILGLKDLNCYRSNVVGQSCVDNFESTYRFGSQDNFVAWSTICINDPSYQGFVFKGEDITQNKFTQDKLEMLDNIVRYAPDMIYWKDKNSLHLGCNDQFAIAAGFKDRSEVIGKSDEDFPWSSEAEKYMLDDQMVIESGKPSLNIEDFMPFSNGKQATVITNKVPLRDRRGDIIGVLGIATDITQQKRVEKALNLAKEEAEAANHAKIEFIANMSHDIRTPLTGVVGMSKILEEAIVEPKHKNYAKWLGESGDQLLKMLNEVLDIVSADNLREVDKHYDAFNVARMVNDIVELEQPSTQLKGLQLIAKVDENIPKALICDHTKLHRILLNLLGNAIKFTQRGQVKLSVSLVKKHKNKACVRFVVADTGIGIPKDLQGKVFDRFFRITPSYKGVYSGSGVGLHIAQSYAHLLGGQIHLNSEVGVGTTFYFDLILDIASDDACVNRVANKQTSDLATGLGLVNAEDVAEDAPLILLIEDNNIARLMLESLVSQAGYRFKSVIDAESALELTNNIDFDLIITDLGLPGISGIEFTNKMRANEDQRDCINVPIIGLTAHADPKIKEGCINSGMNEAYTKPMSASILDNIKVNYFSSLKKSIYAKGRKNRDGELGDLGLDLPSTEKELFQLDTFAILDVNKALGAIGNNMILLRSILQSMLDNELPNDIKEIKNYHAKQDWPGVEKIAHRLKGGLVYCGADRLACACQYLERYKKAGLSAMLEELYQQLLIVADETFLAIKKWLG